jgi:SAM-dependent methyltransferase
MNLRDCLGLKFPDEYVTRFFFKEALQSKGGTALELGCGNGNNLALFHTYGYSVTGVDISRTAIDQAQRNFTASSSQGDGSNFSFIQEDMQSYLNRVKEQYEVVLLPSSLYYLPENEIEDVLRQTRRNMKPGSRFYLRMRTAEDYRWGKGNALSERSWRLTTSVTGELDCVVTFYKQEDFAAILSLLWRPVRITWCRCRFDNPQNGILVTNDDFIVWGEV